MVAASKEIIKEAMDSAGAVLAKLGYKKRGQGIFTAEIAKGVLGWVGLNTATQTGDGLVWVNPMIAVRHQQVEEEVARLTAAKPHAYAPPTLGQQLGYLTPAKELVSFKFGPGIDANEVAAALGREVAAHGRPFMDAHASLAALRDAIAGGKIALRESAIYRLPVVLALLGDAAGAERALAETQAEIGARTDLAAAAWKRFAEAFRASPPRAA